ncbi:MAG: SpaA isopeptide-forming pilin-related protein [Gemmiger sp.]|nr:SpaA isopeptide-forming pilin-related protein [Gemmiger sp.]
MQIRYGTTLAKGFQEADRADITNKAKMIWNQFGYGPGPSTPLIWDITIDKGVAGTYDHVQKSAAPGELTVNPDGSRTAGWEFKINQYRQAIKGLTITEKIIPANTDRWAYTYYQDGNQMAAGTVGTDATAPLYYTAEPNADGTSTVVFHFADLAAEDYYLLHIESDVTAQLATTDNAHSTIANTAHYAYEGGAGSPFEVTGTKDVENELITKACVKDYDAATKTIQWQITLNSHNLPITGALLTDTLPKGNVFASVDSAARNGVAGTVTEGKITFGGEGTVAYTVQMSATPAAQPTEGEQLAFDFAQHRGDNAAYTFTFTTKMGSTAGDAAYLDALLAQNRPEAIRNTVELSKGEIAGVEILDKAGQHITADAATNVNDKALAKGGVFDPETGRVTWTIELNKGLVDMTGKKIVDDFTKNSDPDLLQLVIEDGKPPVKVLAAGQDVTESVQAGFTKVTEMGFVFTVPASVKNKQLTFIFETWLTDDANLADVTNKVGLYTDGKTDPDEDITSDGLAGGDFWFDDYAAAQSSPYVRVNKLSASTSAGGAQLLPLGGAQFTLTAYRKDATDGVYKQDTTLTMRARTTRTTGAANFLNLRRGVLYKIEETEAAAGYDKAGAPTKWVYFNGDGEAESGKLTVAGVAEPFAPDYEGKNSKAYKITVSNTANAGVEFTKLGQNGQALAGVTFRLVRKTDNKVEEKTAVSGVDGKVRFAQVDPGNYEVYEVFDNATTPAGYENLGNQLLMKITVVGDTAQYTDLKEGYATADASGAVTVQNKLLTAGIGLTKKDQNGTALPGVQFTLAGKNLPSGSDWTAESQYTTDANGKLAISGLPCGDYTLTERTSGESYTAGKVQKGVAITFTVGRDENGGVTLTDTTDSANPKTLPGVQGKFDLGNVENTLKYGSINLHKISKEINGTTSSLSGISFTLEQKIGGGYKAFATLKTDANGELAQNADGSYTDIHNKAFYLVYGDYRIKETAAPTAHKAAGADWVEFTVSDDTVGAPAAGTDSAPGCVWVTDGGLIQNRVDKTVPAAITNGDYTNEIVRGTLKVTKTSTVVTGNLPGAKFMVYADGDTKVATLADPDGDGVYDTLTPATPAATVKINNLTVPYLAREKETAPYQLLAGSYTLKEVIAPAGHGLAAPVAFTIEEGTTQIEKEVKDPPFAVKVQLHKVGVNKSDKTAYEVNLANVAFTLAGKDMFGGSYQQTAKTDAKGLLSFADLRANADGEYYTLTETGAPGGSEYGTQEVYHIYIDKNTRGIRAKRVVDGAEQGEGTLIAVGNPLRIENIIKQRSFSFIKKGVTSEGTLGTAAALPGAQFVLTGTDGTKGEYKSNLTGADGKAQFTDIPHGKYTMTELAPAGYKAITPVAVEIRDDGSVMIAGVSYTNPGAAAGAVVDCSGYAPVDAAVALGLTLRKLNSAETKTAVAGAAYRLSYANGDAVAAYPNPIKTDANGGLLCENLLAGKSYQITEPAPAPGYHLSSEVITFDVVQTSGTENAVIENFKIDGKAAAGSAFSCDKKADNAYTLTWKEQPFSLTVTKQNKNGEPLAGAALAIYDNANASGTALYTGQTNAAGQWKLPNAAKLTANTNYWVKETAAPAGYTTGMWAFTTDAAKTLAATASGTQSITVHDGVTAVAVKLEKLGVFTDDPDIAGAIAGAKFTVSGTFAEAAKESDPAVTADAFADVTITLPVSAATTGEILLDKTTLGGKLLIADGKHSYTLTEIDAPDGYAIHAPVTFTVTSDEQGTIVTSDDAENTHLDTLTIWDAPLTTDLSLTKYDNETEKPLPGAKFTLAGTTFDGRTFKKQTQTSDAAGKLRFTGIPAGNYTLHEERMQGYEQTADFTVTVKDNGSNGLTTTVTGTGAADDKITNTVIRRGFSFTKYGTDDETDLKHSAKLAGATFGLYTDSACAVPVAAPVTVTAKSDKNGLVTFKNLGCGSYYLKELSAPANYTPDPTVYTVVVGGNTTITTVGYNKMTVNGEDLDAKKGTTAESDLAVTNEAIRGRLTLNKFNKDAPTEKVDGAKYALYKGETKLDEQVTKNGTLQFKNLLIGTTYTVKETAAPAGYQLSGESFTVKFALKDGKAVPKLQSGANALFIQQAADGSITWLEQPVRLEITKQIKNGTALPGAKLELRGPKATSPDAVVESWTSDGSAHRVQAALTQGATYTLYEVATPAPCYATAAPQEITISTTADTAGILGVGGTTNLQKEAMTDEIAPLTAQLQKYLNYGGSVVATPAPGATFTLAGDFADPATGVIESATFTLDMSKTGSLTLGTATLGGKQLILGGSYTLTETDAPEYYALYKNPITFAVKPDGTLELTTAAGSHAAATGDTLAVTDDPLTADLTLAKRGIDPLVGGEGTALGDVTFTLVGTDFNGNAITPLSGTTAADGSLRFTGLTAGNYTLTETRPAGYEQPATYTVAVADTGKDALAVTITDAGTQKPLAPGKDGVYTLHNTLVRRSFTFHKQYKDRENGIFAAYNPNHTSPAAGVTFSLYADSACTGTPLQTAVSDQNGAVLFSNLACGSYYFKETAAKDETMVLADTVYTVNIGTDGTAVITADGATYTGKVEGQKVETDLTITNDVVRGAFEMVKVNESNPGQTLPGSKYGLFRAPYPEDAQPALLRMLGSLFGRAATAADGADGEPSHGIPAGYIKVAEGVTDQNGRLKFDGLLTGVRYYIRELAAPAGYQISKNPIEATFTLTAANANVPAQIELKGNGSGTASIDPDTGLITWLEPVYRLGIRKTDMGTADLRGATLALYNAEGTELTRWVSDGTEHILLGSDMLAGGEVLVAGRSYTLKELAAPNGYELAAPITFQLETPLVGPGQNWVQHVVMQDKKIPQAGGQTPASTPAPQPGSGNNPATPIPATPIPATSIPATGDATNPLLYLVLLLGSGATLAGLYVGRSKRGNK